MFRHWCADVKEK